MTVDTFINPQSIGLVLTATLAWLASKQDSKIKARKMAAETESAILDVKIKEDNFESTRYSKLLDRVILSEQQVETAFQMLDAKEKEMKEMRTTIEKLSTANRELIAELNMYRATS